MTVRFLDPTVAPDVGEATAATRVAGLDGKVIGLLSNGKVNADRLLDLVREGLAARYRLRRVRRRFRRAGLDEHRAWEA
ncbi:MAG: hypothetical protein HYR86_02870, partial [Candidatus Rokubacteria bacterium]|nr:hypothetical protein [Candidatus Rokubacteria bacterium]